MIKATELPAVVSYWRSGTHWLCSLMHQWFYYGMLEHQIIQNSILPFRTWHSDNAKSYRWAKLFGGHIYDPASPMAKKLHPRKIIYLFRPSSEVLPSLWRLRMAEAQVEAWPTYTFPQYLRMRPPLTEDGNTFPAGLNTRDLCEWSQSEWIDSDAFMVSYPKMIGDLDRVRDSLAQFLGKKPEKLKFPADRRVGHIVPQGQHTNDELWEMAT